MSVEEEIFARLAGEITSELDEIPAPEMYGVRIIFINTDTGEKVARIYPLVSMTEHAVERMSRNMGTDSGLAVYAKLFAAAQKEKRWTFPDGNWEPVYHRVVKLAEIPF